MTTCCSQGYHAWVAEGRATYCAYCHADAPLDVTVMPQGRPRLTCTRCQCDSGVDMPSVGHAEWRCEVCAMHARLAKLFDVLGTAGPFTEKWRDDMIALFADALAFVPKAVK